MGKICEKKKIRKVRLGYAKENLNIDCIAFVKNLAILTADIKSAEELFNILMKTAQKTGLRISIDKTKNMTDIRYSPNYLITNFGRIRKKGKLKYLGDIIQSNELDREANKARINKLQKANAL